MNWRLAGIAALTWVIAGCSSNPSQSSEDVACATSSLFAELQARNSESGVRTGDMIDPIALDRWLATGCAIDEALGLFATSAGLSSTRLADELVAAGQPKYAVAWYQHEPSERNFSQLIALYSPNGALADDAQLLRTEIQRAQWQQSMGREVTWPRVSQAQPLYVQTERTGMQTESDFDAPVLEALAFDQRVYLIDVVMLADSDEYWVEAYFPQTLTLGWIPAEDLAQHPQRVRRALAEVDAVPQRQYAQQVIFSALIAGMPLQSLQALDSSEFFNTATQQQVNSLALLRRLGTTTDICQSEVQQLEDQLARYLVDEGPAPQADDAPHSRLLREAIAALTQRPAPGVEVDATLAEQLSQRAYQYFRIRSYGQLDQRLCFSLPNAAGNRELAGAACDTMASLQRCVNRVDALLTISANSADSQ